MATYTNFGAKYRTCAGKTAEIRTYPEAASQSFVAGDFVTLSSGKVTALLAASGTYASADVDSAGAGAILGMVLHNASGVTDTACRIVIANGDTEFYANLVNSSMNVTTAVTHVSTNYDLAHFTSGGVTAWGVTQDDTTNPNVEVMELDPSYPVGEALGPVWFRVIAASRQHLSA